jgi:hypothetical protein
MDLGERISPARVSDFRKVFFNVEPLSDARTMLVEFFSILLQSFVGRNRGRQRQHQILRLLNIVIVE